MLYIVATPIGNLKDISLRALDTLKMVDVIACEDTRNSIKLLSHFEISKPLITYHKFNEKNSADGILKLLNEGKNVALISDSGMPLVSDPGYVLTKLLREKDIPFTVIPGANAALSALTLSGIDSMRFAFIGFLPEDNKNRKKLLEEVKNYKLSLIFHISPHSLEKDIADISNVMQNRRACLVKEITKLHENAYSFTLGEKIDIEPRGEYVLVCEGAKDENKNVELTIDQHLDLYLAEGLSQNDAIKKVAKERGLEKNVIYQHVIKSKM